MNAMGRITGGLAALGLILTGCASATPSQPTPSAANPPPAVETPATNPAAQPTTLEVVHAQGRTTVPRNPTRVVTFDYSVLDTLDQLGVPLVGVPQASLPSFLAKYKDARYTNVGTLFEPDYEKLNALKPDLIIVGGRSAAVYDELSKLAPTIDLTVDADDIIPSFKAHTMSLAAIFGMESEVMARLGAIDNAISRVKARAGASTKKGLIVLVTGGKVTAYGPGSRFGIIHEVFGVVPADPTIEVATHGNAVSFEYIQETNPDLLYVIDRDPAVGQQGVSAKQVLDNPLVRETKAWANNSVIYLNPNTWYLASTGLGTMASMIDEIDASLR